MSTECVFDGKKCYAENGAPKPLNWYGYTKYMAEKEIINSGISYSVIRSVVAYNKEISSKTFYGRVFYTINNNKKFYAVGDVLFTPTYTSDIAKSIVILIKKQKQGIFHVVPRKSLTPYEFALMIANKFNKNDLIIKSSINEVFDKRKARLRLKKSCLTALNTYEKLNFIPKSPEEVI